MQEEKLLRNKRKEVETMKAMVCEMCSGNDFVKTDGMFVCQSCGTKYSPEEAKKMMIEGTVDVKGVVTVDNTATVQKYLQNARRAKSKEDWSEVERYYNLVEQEDPTNIEAIFYSAYGKAKQSLVESDIYKRQSAFKVLNKSVSVIDDNFDNEKADEQFPVVEQIYHDIIKMKGSEFVYNTVTTTSSNGIRSTTDDRYKTYALFNTLIEEMLVSLGNIFKMLTKLEYKLKVIIILIVHEEEKIKRTFGVGDFRDKTARLENLYKQRKLLQPSFKPEDELDKLEKEHDEAKKKYTASVQKKGLGQLIGGIVVVLIGFWAYNTFLGPNEQYLPGALYWKLGMMAPGAVLALVGLKKLIFPKKI